MEELQGIATGLVLVANDVEVIGGVDAAVDASALDGLGLGDRVDWGACAEKVRGVVAGEAEVDISDLAVEGYGGQVADLEDLGSA